MTERFSNCVRRSLMCAVLPIAALTLTTSAHAEEISAKARYAKEIGASERINYSGKLRMLSQRVVATSCNAAAGIAPGKSEKAMQAAKAEFNQIVKALEFGDPDLGIRGEEKRKKTIRRIGMLNELWGPMAAELSSVENNDAAQDVIPAIADNSAPLLEMAKLLVSDLSAQYSDPHSLVQANAMLVDISGRQRMLAQRMSKNVCLLASGVNVETAKPELEKTAEIFETSLYALRGGMVSVGINPPPNDAIASGLDVVVNDWTALRPFVDAVLAGEPLSEADREKVFLGMNQMTGNMNKVVGMYSDASKHGS
jgi:hypothetical protein